MYHLENVQLMDKYNLRNPSKGTLYFATTHLIFVDHDMKKETWRLPITTTGSPLLVRTKTFQSVFFVIPRERDCHEMHQTLLRLSQPAEIEELYCFHYKSTPEDLPKSAGWNFFDVQTEFQRMNVPNEQSRGRLPALAYLHHNKAAIARCSQPLSGFSARCMEDEQMLDLIRRANPNCGYMYVVDTRPRWIASAIQSGVSVCVHCSDGWDRTAQACSLAALLLEPHYRTINGYQALIEKDWLSFGHKFTMRCGHVACDGRERSPVFTQLLDCTWQLLRQSTEAFQFNERFLLTLHDHVHACQYGTFVGN
ncbi:hypothetical protein MSG28_009106, partial [Choristoneura fumiferana]